VGTSAFRRPGKHPLRKHCLLLIVSALVWCTVPSLAAGQELPKKIRGYRVHNERINVTAADDADTDGGGTRAKVTLGDPEDVEVALAGVTFKAGAEFMVADQSGRVDFLTFHDVRVNGIPVEIEEYQEPFSFKKNEPVSLPEPASVFLPTERIVQAAWREMRGSKDEWTVTGRVFVFGRFRKYGFYHKRVVPVDFTLMIKNPLIGPGPDDGR